MLLFQIWTVEMKQYIAIVDLGRGCQKKGEYFTINVIMWFFKIILITVKNIIYESF